MKTLIIKLIVLFSFLWPVATLAQGENNIWTFGHGYSLDFNHSPALLKDTVYWNNQPNRVSPPNNVTFSYHRSSAVCDAAGNLLFMVKFFDAQSAPNAPCIFDRYENPIAGTDFLQTALADVEQKIPTVVPHPGNPNQYYIFYVRNRGLLYSLFDLNLNNGLGDIVSGQKDVLVSNYNTVVGHTMTTVQGCDGIWLVVRHFVNNGFLSFKIDRNGFQPVPVVSEAGYMFPITNLNTYSELIASADGTKLAVASGRFDNYNIPGGVELYDFQKCNGKVKNTKVLDLGNDNYGIAFSPDGSKLYVASKVPIPGSAFSHNHYLHQFDLSLSTLTDIELSKTLVITNPAVQWNINFCPNEIGIFSTMRIGPDKKLYILNGAPEVCLGSSGVGLAFHVINFPDQPGITCSPNLNAIYNFQNGMVRGTATSRTYLPRVITVPAVNTIDTIINPTVNRNVCFKNEDRLSVPSDASCIEWSTGSTDSFIVVSDNGKYGVRYFKECKVYIDTFNVKFHRLPEIDRVQYGCPGLIMLKAGNRNGFAFGLDLHNSRGGKIYGGNAKAFHEIYNLDEGIYVLKITAGSGCDTSIEVELKSYPIPDITVSPPSATISFGESVKLTADGAYNFTWEPASSLNSRTHKTVLAKPEITTVYSVVGVNDYGCRDTATVSVEVSFNKNIKMPNAFTPNGDGLNDIFRIPSGTFKVRRFEVYNRYGQLVFAEMGSRNGWNGTFNGVACDAAVYNYNAILDFPDQTYILIKGEVTLLR